MTHFLGEYEVAIDAKGRFLLPSGFRKQLPEDSAPQFVLNRGFEHCLSFYLRRDWDQLAGRILKLNDFNSSVREFKRLFLNGATPVEADQAGRILIPRSLLEYGGIKKDMVFSAQGNKVELWDKDTYYQYLKEKSDNFSSLAEQVAGSDFQLPGETV